MPVGGGRRLDPRAYGLVMGSSGGGGVPQWVVDQGIAPGDRISFDLYAGRGMRGPEYKQATGRVHLLGPAGPVVVLPGDRFGARPVVVTAQTFRGVVSRKKNPPKEPAKMYGRFIYDLDIPGPKTRVERFLKEVGTITAQFPPAGYQIQTNLSRDSLAKYLRDAMGTFFQFRKMGNPVRARRARVARVPRRRSNPALGIIGLNPPGRGYVTVSTRCLSIAYLHAEDGREYEHEFAPGVSATFLPDGRCVLWRRDGRPVWGTKRGNHMVPAGA